MKVAFPMQRTLLGTSMVAKKTPGTKTSGFAGEGWKCIGHTWAFRWRGARKRSTPDELAL